MLFGAFGFYKILKSIFYIIGVSAAGDGVKSPGMYSPMLLIVWSIVCI